MNASFKFLLPVGFYLSMAAVYLVADSAVSVPVPHRPETSVHRGFVHLEGSIWNWGGEKDVYLFNEPGRMGIKFKRLAVCDEHTYKELEKRNNEAVEILGYDCHWGSSYSWVTVLEIRTIDGPLPYEEELTDEES